MATTSHMFMYSLTIQPPTAITQAILGQFAGTKEQQIVTASGSKLTIHRPDPAQGKITPIFSQDVFGIIRSLAAFRLAGSNKGMFFLLPLPSYEFNLVILQASRAARSFSEPIP
jgi:splicing factor 3B subunit 3